MAIVKIKKLALRTLIGFNPEEKVKKQDVLLNLEIQFESQIAESSDNANDTFDYKKITKRVIEFVEESQFDLLEALTKAVLDLIMEDPRVVRAQVEIDKPHALRFAESVSITLESFRSQVVHEQ